jgi:tol-pal system protein YbgF
MAGGGSMRAAAVLLLAAAVVAAGPAVGADRRAAKSNADEAMRQNLLDIVQQLDTLQTEVRQLRNSVEVQGHELEQLKARQRSLYDDLDQRLRESEKQRAAAPVAAAASAPTAATDVPVSKRVTTPAQQQEYDAAFNLMKVGQYDKAVKAFRAFLAKHPDSGLADNAQYWIAEGNYVLRNYKLALEEFAKVLEYPQSTKAADAQLKIGYAHYELGAYDQARKALTEAQQRYPGTTVAKLAAVRLEKMTKEGR